MGDVLRLRGEPERRRLTCADGTFQWADDSPCAHRGDPCAHCGRPFPLRPVAPLSEDVER